MTSSPFTLRWGILATGGIATTFTKDLLINPSTRDAHDIHHVVAAAASSNSSSRAETFLRAVGAPQEAVAHGSYSALVHDPNVDIVYIATPHSHHYQHTRLALEAGKHVLVEKPITINASQARVLYSLAKDRNLFLMEAVWTRFFPLTRSIQEVIASGRLGTIKRVSSDLSFWNDVEAEFGSEHRMVNTSLGGGALLDLGVYSLTWVFLVLWHLQRDGERVRPGVKGWVSKYEATGCDEMTSVVLDFRGAGVGSASKEEGRDNGDAHALALTSLRVSYQPSPAVPEPSVRIQGTRGDILVHGISPRPLSYTLVPAQNEKRGKLADFEVETKAFEIPGGGHGMFWEADECARCVRDGKLESEVMGWEESVGVMEVMDEVRRQGGVVYGAGLESEEYPLEGFGI
jgi:predicted dehydrogenase